MLLFENYALIPNNNSVISSTLIDIIFSLSFVYYLPVLLGIINSYK